ncbi:uncharacterized protein LAESUDRAFT_324884 [Laetiporus sulphureus 93-53]|uniref:Uncharacterized protein n=1 Tax=Laetiporus sulphureus 93-53 TaxID=1314785 RepID=A0A165CYX2_9APHY|nr:uncharacterized protein LAESUDRAFT_324884 [Laetiporus sulphureus 93-53]KZT03776.1 hypothetical protein LAESUDRAFT_324884 [Laetiporus sulphureus 93-53]
MVDWQSEAEIAQDGVAFGRFMHTLLGLYIWEWATSLDFDWEFISGKRKFRWPMIFYFAGRYFLLFALIGIAIALNVSKPINCQALYTYNQVFGNGAIGLASINLSLRTMAVWSQAWYIVVPLVAIILGHWSLLLHGILIKAAWIPGSGCTITNTDNTLLAATFIYSMCFDFLVLILTAYKLAFPTRRRDQSRIVQLIFGDGLIYFMIAFLANLLATIFMLLDLNAVMSIIANVPAAVCSTIVACRVVRRLSRYTSPGVEIFGSTMASTLAFTHGGRSRGGPVLSVGDKKEGVHVQMETFAAVSETVPSDQSFLQYDAIDRIKTDIESLNTDAPPSPEEMKRPVI